MLVACNDNCNIRFKEDTMSSGVSQLSGLTGSLHISQFQPATESKSPSVHSKTPPLASKRRNAIFQNTVLAAKPTLSSGSIAPVAMQAKYSKESLEVVYREIPAESMISSELFSRIINTGSNFLAHSDPISHTFKKLSIKDSSSTVETHYFLKGNSANIYFPVSKKQVRGQDKLFTPAFSVQIKRDNVDLKCHRAARLMLIDNANVEHREDFQEEVKTLRRLKGTPGICRLLDASCEEDYVMYQEQYDGDLDQFLELNKGKPLAMLLKLPQYCLQFFNTIAELHRNNIAHCDLKIRNIFFNKDGVVFGDFCALDRSSASISSKELLNYMITQTRTKTAVAIPDRYPTDIWALGYDIGELTEMGTRPIQKYADILIAISSLNLCNFGERMGSIEELKILSSIKNLNALVAQFKERPALAFPHEEKSDEAREIDDGIAIYHRSLPGILQTLSSKRVSPEAAKWINAIFSEIEGVLSSLLERTFNDFAKTHKPPKSLSEDQLNALKKHMQTIRSAYSEADAEESIKAIKAYFGSIATGLCDPNPKTRPTAAEVLEVYGKELAALCAETSEETKFA